jgi:hypothetical protein
MNGWQPEYQCMSAADMISTLLNQSYNAAALLLLF